MTDGVHSIYDLMTDKGIDMRTAAYVHALNRISVAIESLGTNSYFANDMVSR